MSLEDNDSQADHGDDAGEVSQREAADDARGGGLLLGLGDLAHGRVAVRGVIHGDLADDGPDDRPSMMDVAQ